MSQKSAVRNFLMSGRALTPIDALNLFGSFRLAAIICDLRKEGDEIITESCPVIGRDGRKKIVAKYRMAV